jgi:hypothetical protein
MFSEFFDSTESERNQTYFIEISVFISWIFRIKQLNWHHKKLINYFK